MTQLQVAIPSRDITLPIEVKTRDGAIFDPRLSLWHYRDGVTNVKIDFNDLPPFADVLMNSLKSVLIWFAQRQAAAYLKNLYKEFLHFTRKASFTAGLVEQISDIDLINFRSTLGHADWRFGTLRALLKKWMELQYPGISTAGQIYLEATTVKGNRKGAAVLTWDPYLGQFSELEWEALHSGLNLAYEQGEIKTPTYILCWLQLTLGPRPIQLASLKLCDLHVENENADTAYYLSVPRAKQRGVVRRVLKKRRKIAPRMGEIIASYRDTQVKMYEHALPDDPTQGPMFGTWREPANGWPAGFKYHRSDTNIGDIIEKSFERLGILSERTGELINISPIRFRRTVATRMAAEGYGSLVIAEALDHEDIQNVKVYAGLTSEMAERIDRAMAEALAPIIQAFVGTLIDGPEEATRIDGKITSIRDLRSDTSGKVNGSCGSRTYCDANAPIPCYTCHLFEPWLDGPHEKILEYLLDRRERIMASTNDLRIASINDRTIFAVQYVIQKCEEKKRTMNVG